jgi:hypothetical protein
LEQVKKGTRRKGRAMKFSPDADPKKVEEYRRMDQKKNQDITDFLNIFLSDASEESLKKAKKAVYGKD